MYFIRFFSLPLMLFVLALGCKSGPQLTNAPAAVPAVEGKPIAPFFDWQGHRGCRGLLPENTIPAFLRAAEIPEVTTLELDLAISKDNKLIVSHEPWFHPEICRLPNGDTIPQADAERHLLYQMTQQEIKAWDCGSWGHPRFPQQQKMKAFKPAFRDVVFAVRRAHQERPIRWNIEIKSEPQWDGLRHPPVAEFARLVVDEIRFLHIDSMVTVQSFDVRALQEVHKLAPQIKLALLVENQNGFQWNLDALGFQPAIYSPYYEFVDKKLVEDCHKRGIYLIPWTVNDKAAMQKLIDLGVDGIITDYPNLIAGLGR
ncbi:MAG: glycerophosphodiester phosphodiesterase [Saprospiraceae bacterium]|nr:glycerophosphodiester phosphodiesterase [Saprospiraceae bacterium]